MRAKIIEMARKAGFNEFTGGLRDDGSRDTYLDCWPEQLERFYELAQAEEREACEALYEHEDVQAPVGNSAWGEAYQEGWIAGAQAYREAIRARTTNQGK